jgi:hypothetical protein
VASDPVTTPPGLSTAEWEMVQEMSRQAIRREGYNRGIEAAAQQAEAWADQCCGGSGEGGEGYRNLAVAIRRMAIDV